MWQGILIYGSELWKTTEASRQNILFEDHNAFVGQWLYNEVEKGGELTTRAWTGIYVNKNHEVLGTLREDAWSPAAHFKYARYGNKYLKYIAEQYEKDNKVTLRAFTPAEDTDGTRRRLEKLKLGEQIKAEMTKRANAAKKQKQKALTKRLSNGSKHQTARTGRKRNHGKPKKGSRYRR